MVRRKVTHAKDLMILKEQQKKMQAIEQDTKKYTALIELTEADVEKIKTDLVEFAEKTTEELSTENVRVSDDIERLNGSIAEEKSNLDKLKEGYADENARIRMIEEERLPKLKKRGRRVRDNCREAKEEHVEEDRR